MGALVVSTVNISVNVGRGEDCDGTALCPLDVVASGRDSKARKSKSN